MCTQWRARRFLRVLGLPLVLAGGLFGPGLSAPAAPAAPCQSWTGVPPPSSGTGGTVLAGVALVSACDAWAVGSASDGTSTQPLTEHWDGARWTVVPGPVFGGSFSTLSSVTAVSATDVWAVGSTDADSGGDQTLTEHWDGTRWTVVPSPDPGSSFNHLRAVTTDSAGNVWAVGEYSSGSGNQTLILVWTGTFWREFLPSPNPAHDNTLTAVAATSASDVWAVGFTGLLAQTLILHWNGSTWTQVPSPTPGFGADLAAVAATSGSDAWAAGATDNGTVDRTLILHWDGSTWTQVPSPNQGGTSAANSLTGVAATSPTSAWAVGRSITGTAHASLILYWNGTTWARVPAAHPGTTSDLFAVAAASASNAWAVGTYADTGAEHPLALHCC